MQPLFLKFDGVYLIKIWKEYKMKKIRSNKMAITIFLFPAAVLFAIFIIIPIFMSLYYSFMEWDGIGIAKWIGLENYIDMFNSPTIKFGKAIKNSLLIAFASTVIQLPISLFFALILSRKIKFNKAFLTIYFIPVLISSVAIGQLWMRVYNADYGVLNYILRVLGLENWTKNWLGDQKTAMGAVLIPIVWQYIGYHMLILYSGIKSVPEELIESAKIDGATEVQTARFVTIPMIKPIMKVSVIFAITGSLKIFDLIYVLTNGGPARATEVPTTLMISMLFSRNKYGMGSAMAIFIILECFLFSILIQKIFNERE